MLKTRGSALLITEKIAKKHNVDLHTIFGSYDISENGKIEADAWYEVFENESQNPCYLLAEKLFPGQPDKLRKLGMLQVCEGSSSAHAFFYSVSSPKIVLSRAAKIWETFFNLGRIDCEITSHASATIHIKEWPFVPAFVVALFCGSLDGLGILMRRRLEVTLDGSNTWDYRLHIQWHS